MDTETSYPRHKIKVVLLENIHQTAVEAFTQAGYTVELHKAGFNGDALVEVAGDAHIVGVRSKSNLTPEFLAQAKRLWAIGCFCIGTNQVALEDAARRGIPVFNAPFSNTRSVAELVIAEIVALHRKLGDRSSEMHRGLWKKSAIGSHEIRGKRLGIVGYGRIGSQVSVLAEAMGMRVYFYDVVDVLPLGNAQRVSTLEDLLAAVDVVTLHVPGTEHTANMIRGEQLAQMRHGSYLLNNARGDVVDVEALAAVVRSGHLAGAAVDVFPSEPSSNDEPFESPLRGLPNVVLTPHIGGSTVEAQEDIGQSVASRLVRLMDNGSTHTAVNVPEVTLPLLHPDHHRFLHWHRNVPGVLSKMHTAIAELGINIAASHLQSNAAVAYAIIDVESTPNSDALKTRLAQIPGTISVRMLW